jgi:hypothetical protein
VDLSDGLRIDVLLLQVDTAGVARAPLGGVIADADDLGIVGLLPPVKLGKAVGQVRERAARRPVVVGVGIECASRMGRLCCSREV